MKDLIHAELLKLRTTRALYGNAFAALAFVPIFIAIAIGVAGPSGPGPALSTGEGIRNVMSSASSGDVVVLILGILVMAGEFRHTTATSTFLISPDRRVVVRAKLAASALVGAMVGLVASGLTLFIALPWLAAKNVDVTVLSGDVAWVLLRGVAVTSLYAVIGVGLGALIRNQTAAVVIALVWVTVVESLLVSLAPAVGRWLPGGAATALSAAATPNGGLLPAWGGALLLLGYGLVFTTAGSRMVTGRDVS